VRSLWRDLGSEVEEVVACGSFVRLKNGLKLKVKSWFRECDLDKALIDTLAIDAHQRWYSHIIGLVLPELKESYKEALMLKKDKDGVFYLVHYQNKELESEVPVILEEFRSFCLSYAKDKTPTYARQWADNIMKQEFQEKYGEEAPLLFIPLSRMVNELDQNRWWASWINQDRDMQKPKEVQVSYELVRLSVQALATLHMNLKRPYDDVMVRYGNQDDFVSALRLFEKIMLPKYLSISIKEQLYDDYYAVTPLVGSFAKKD